MIINYLAVKILQEKYKIDINQFYKNTDMHNQKLYFVEQYKKNILVKSWLEIQSIDFIPISDKEKEYHLTIPSMLVLEYLLELGIEIKLETKNSTNFKNNYTYQVRILSHDILLPEQSEYSNLPSLNIAIETLLITLLEKEIIKVQNGIIVKI